MNRRYILGALVAAVLFLVLSRLYWGGEAPASQPPLVSLSAAPASVKNAFNASKSDVRLLVLLSPT